MRDNNVLYFLFFLLALATYNLYKESQDNERLYKICTDQEDTIQLQLEAINSQKLYINQLKYTYNNLYYGKGSSYHLPNKEKNSSPIH
jgi:regulator of RNase E activity RraB